MLYLMGSQTCGRRATLELMNMDRKPWVRVLIALVFLAIAAGAGWRLYDTGYSHGVTDTLTTNAATGGNTSTVIIRDDGARHGFFPFFLIFPLGFFILFFVVRPFAWRSGINRRRFGPGGMRHEFEDWHRQQHEADAKKPD